MTITNSGTIAGGNAVPAALLHMALDRQVPAASVSPALT
jgi:hypothetical protein